MLNVFGKKVQRYVDDKWNDTTLIREYAAAHRKQLGIGIFALFAVAILDLSLPLIIARGVDLLVEGAPAKSLAFLALLYFLVSCFLAVGRFAWRLSLYSASMYCGRDLRDRFVTHLHHLPKAFFSGRRRGELLALANNDVESVKLILGEAVVFFCDSILYILMIPPLMFYLSPRLTLLVGVPLLIIPFLVVLIEKKIHRRFKKVQRAFAGLSAAAQEALTGVRVVKAFGKEGALTGHYTECGREVVSTNLSLARIESVFDPLLLSVLALSTVLMLFVGGSWVIDGAVTIGVFIAFQRYLRLLVWPMQALGLSFTVLQRAVVSSERLQEVVDLDLESGSSLKPGSKRPVSKDGVGITFDNLSFSYHQNGTPVLQEVSFSIEPGEKIALLGEVGSGKTTLLQLIPRLYSVAPGMLQVGGQDILEWNLEDLRALISYVPQDATLFSGSIYENITLGCPSQAVDLTQEATRSAEIAGVDAEIRAFANGYDTLLGERGVKVSGGQRQRLTIARALMRESQIVIFDDALSAVDLETEKRIVKALRSRGERSTDIVTGQRLSVISNADRIIVLHRGRVLQIGTQQQLMKERDGWFKLFYERQRLQEEMDLIASQKEGIRV